ncbi:MAG: SxtJ family membrane protein [Candidatus Omnitrophota bacterium]
MFEEFMRIKSGRKELREFGLTIGIILVILGGVALWRGKGTYPYLFTAGALFIIPGFILPGILKPLQKAWMGFAIVLGFFMSRLVLTIVFYGVVTPIGLITRISGKDILDEKMDKSKASYWIARSGQARPKEYYEKQF